MNRLPNNPAALAGAALGFLAMTVLGWKMAEQPPPQLAPQPEKTAKAANRPTRHVRKSAPPDAVRQRVAAIRALGTPEERMRATIELASYLPVSEIEAWMEGRWFITGHGFDLSLFNKILTERWNKEDPEGLLTWKLKNNSGRAGEMLAALAEKNPERVAAYFKDHLTKDQQLQALPKIARKNPALALQCLSNMPALGVSEIGMSDYYTSRVLTELAKSSPTELQAALASMPTGLKSRAESALIGQRLQTSFGDEFKQLLERPDGWKILSANLSNIEGLGDKVFDQLADLPAAWKSSLASNPYHLVGASTASKWWDADLESMGFSAGEAKRIRSTALDQMADKQPEQALKLLGTADLDASARSSVISNIFDHLERNPEKAEALLALLGSDEEKQQARDIIDANSETDSGKKLDKPSDWLEKVATFDLKSGNSYVYLSLLRQWDPDKISDLSNQFRAMPDDKKAQVAQVIAENSYETISHDLVGDAIRYLVTQPAPAAGENQGRSRDPVSPASQFAVTWAKTDPAAAGSWVQSLPAGDARLWAQKNLAANWAQYDPQEAAQWVKSLPVDERGKVEHFMKTGGD
ncbi:MAG: hypothetical protein V4819_18915 [Verrucomicrobiota bacterium]